MIDSISGESNDYSIKVYDYNEKEDGGAVVVLDMGAGAAMMIFQRGFNEIVKDYIEKSVAESNINADIKEQEIL